MDRSPVRAEVNSITGHDVAQDLHADGQFTEKNHCIVTAKYFSERVTVEYLKYYSFCCNVECSSSMLHVPYVVCHHCLLETHRC